MTSSTIRLQVNADTFSDIIEAAEDELMTFLGINYEELKKVQYELLIDRDPDMKAEFTYRAEVIAKVKQ